MNKKIKYINRLFFFLFFSSSCQLLFGQNNLDNISKIIFFYESGHSDWGRPGIYSVAEKIELIKSSNHDGLFRVSNFIQIKKKYTGQLRQHLYDTAGVDSGKKRFIKEVHIRNLLVELNESKDNFRPTFLMIYLDKLTNKEIFKIADEYGMRDKIVQKGKAVLKQMQRFYLLDSFLSGQKDFLRYPLISTDSWDFLSINIIGQGDTVKYYSQLSQPLGQPFSKLGDSSTNETNFVNLNINLIVMDILPMESFVRRRLDLNSIRKPYVKWYLDNIVR